MGAKLFFFFDYFFALANKAVAFEQSSIQPYEKPQTKDHENIDQYYCQRHNFTSTIKLRRRLYAILKGLGSNVIKRYCKSQDD